ncbi:MAG TPA: peptidylprolyl isomerase [Bacteroidota bacterium]|nr:peptidylprolyl isomerase [Bacteroidota bacterium]
MRILKWMSLVFVGGLIVGIAGCGSQKAATVAEIGTEKVSLQEFETMFAKNNGGWDGASKTSIEDREKFLDLYVKYKLKVKEAYARGYDKDPELKGELNEYRKNLALTYLIDKEITGPALEEMYARRSQEVRASHILVMVKENAPPADTLAAYNKAMAIIDSLKSGRSFEELAVRNSQDPSAANNKGDLYYFTGGSMVPEFESAVFSLKVGEVTMVPVRTQFGYHIIKVTDKKANPGQVNPAHIMKRLTRTSSAADSLKARTEMQAVLDSLKAGVDFAELAKRHSDDTWTAPQGGDLGMIERRRTVKEFDSVAFSLKPGQISGIVATPFGLHIIKVLSFQPVKPFAEMVPDLKAEYQRTRYQSDYNRLVEQIKRQYGYTQNAQALQAFASAVDTTKTTSDAKWDSTVSKSVRAQTLLTFAGTAVSIDTVITLAKTNSELQGVVLKDGVAAVKTIADKVGTNLVMEHHARQMEDKFPRFKSTMKEYEEGILLFKAEQEEVWNKVAAKDSLLRIYYKENASKYTWPDRVNVQEIFVTTDSVAQLVKRALAGSTRDSVVSVGVKKSSKRATKKPQTITITIAPISFDSAAVLYNTRAATIDKKGINGLLPVTQNELTTKAWAMKEGDVSEPFPYEAGISIIKVLKKDPARTKTFEEALSEVSGQYQDAESKRLENLWQSYLMNKYIVTLHPDVVKYSFGPDSKPAGTKDEELQ